jgi:hypothetical protein
MIALAGCDASFWASSPHPQPIGPGCPAWTAPVKSVGFTPPANADAATLAAYNAKVVEQTTRPVRNLYTLTQRLMNHKAGHIACQATTTPPEEQVGDQRTFWVINASQSGYHQITARLDYVTPHLYDYVQVGAEIDHLALKLAADRFEAQTYSVDRAAFGNQWSLGPDHQPRITLLNAMNLGPIGGYFSSEDEYPTAINPYSNARQMIYLNLNGGARPGYTFYDATLAHEFQHMIHWWARPFDPSWVNEGMSVLAQRLNGLPTNGLERQYFNAPQTPLINGWTDDSAANLPRYGAALTFMDYFYERYGGDAALRALMASNAPVPQAFDQALSRLHSRDRFNDVYSKFLVAALVNDPTFANGAYAFSAFPDERAHATEVGDYPYAVTRGATSGALAQYGAAYYDFTPPTQRPGAPKTLNIDFSGAPTTTELPNTPAGATGAEWWSNSGDNMDTSLTRTIDLTAANLTPTPSDTTTPTATPTATPTGPAAPVLMTFNAWYRLESGFDYTYVEASTDNGVTWTALPVTDSAKVNPNGENEGNGITGVSGGGSQPHWAQETVDLSAYVGKKIRVRFETVNDDAVHLDGFALDSVSIPAINYFSDAPNDSGWTSDGWVNTTNTLPQQWIVQAVVFSATGNPPQIQRLHVDALTGQAAATFLNFGGEISHVTLIVSPIAPTTFTTAPYQVAASVG